ncbi:MAG TPA: cytochrome P450, partial [Stenomitos sp.]
MTQADFALGPNTPQLIQLLQWIGQPIPLMEQCAQRYGDTFAIRLLRGRASVFGSHPQFIQAIFTAEPEVFDAGASNGLLLPLLGDASLILLDGDRHRRQRQLLMPPFHGERMRAYERIITTTTERIAAQWRTGSTFNLRQALQDISLQVILAAVFGITDEQRFQSLRQLLPSLLDLTGSPLSSSLLFLPALQRDWGAWSPWGRFVRLRDRLDRLVFAEIAERRAHPDPERTDILALMLAARDEDNQPMTDLELRDELMTLLVAGHETTASAIAWAMYWLHREPATLKTLVDELDANVGAEDAKPFSRLPYLGAVCNEALRIYPVAPITFPRILKVPMTIAGREYQPGNSVVPCIYLTHRRPELYPDPATFRPERFLERQFS